MDLSQGVVLLLTGGIYPLIAYYARQIRRACRTVDCLVTLHLRDHPDDAEALERACQD
jgi:hypothetical protein